MVYPNPYQTQMTPWNMGFQNVFSNQQTPQGALLQQLSSGFAPIMTMPQQQMRTGFEHLPGFNSPGMTGMLLNAVVAPMMQQQMSQYGMIPGGLSSQNVMDYMQVQQQQAQQFAMLQRVAQDTTSAGVVDFLGGTAQAFGLEFGPSQQAAARQLGGYAAVAAPYLAQAMPDQLDAMSGRRGSAVVMAQRMADFNRYRLDPATGALGFDAESTEQQATALFNQMYSDENLSRMRGVRAGEIGGLYQELGRRGMLPGADFRTERERITDATTSLFSQQGPERQRIEAALRDAGAGPIQQTAGGAINLAPDQLDALRSQTDVTTQMRAFDSDKIKRSLEGYVDVVSTMKEIFGEQGRTDAPMAELVRSLEALSQGGLTQVSPGRLNQMIRTTTEIAKTSGVTLDAAMMMQQQAAGQMQARGMNPIQAPQITQAGLAEGQALQQGGAFDTPTWGLNDANFHRQLSQTLNIQAADSPAANAINAIFRAEDALGGFEEGTEANALSNALKSGSGVYQWNGQDKSIADLSLPDYRAILAGGSRSIGGADATRFLMQKRANSEFGFENKTFALVRRISQPAELRSKVFEPAAESIISAFLREQGISEEDIPTISENVGTAVGSALQNMSSATFGDREARLDAIADVILANAPEEAFGDTEQERRNAASFQASSMLADMQSQFGGRAALGPDGIPGTLDDGSYGGYGSLANALTAQRPETLERAARFAQRDVISAKLKNNMSGLTGNNWVGNFVDAVRAQEGEDRGITIGELLGRTLGGTDAADAQAAMEPILAELLEAEAEVQNIQKQLEQTPIDDTDEVAIERRAALQKNLDLQLETVRNQASAFQDISNRYGLASRENRLDLEDIRELQAAAGETRANRSDVIQTLFGPAREDILSRGGRLLEEEAFLKIGGDYAEADRASQLKIAELRGDAGDTDTLSKLREGGVDGLTDKEKEIVIQGRRDAISTIPTADALEAYMSKLGISDEDRTPEARTAFTEMLSSQLRAKKIGLNESDLSGINVTEKEATDYLKGQGVENPSGQAVAGAQQMLRAKRYEEKLVEKATQSIDKTASNLSALTTDQRKTIANAEKLRRSLQTNVLYSATQGDFLNKEGALEATEQLEQARNEERELRGYFGSDLERATGVVNLANPELQREAIAYYEASDNADLSLSDEDKAKEGAKLINARYRAARESGEAATADMGRIRTSGDIKSQKLEGDKLTRAEELISRQSMSRDTVAELATSLGLDETADKVEIKRLMQAHRGWGIGEESREWADLIKDATERISGFKGRAGGDQNAYSLLQGAMGTKTAAQFAAEHGITEGQADELYKQGRLLRKQGMLSTLADDDLTSAERADAINKQILSLQGTSTESAREQRMELSGKLTIDLMKGTGTLAEAEGYVA